MRIIISISIMFLLISCKHDPQEKIIPKSLEKISTSVDGVRTDAVDTLISKPNAIDSLEYKSEKGIPVDPK